MNGGCSESPGKKTRVGKVHVSVRGRGKRREEAGRVVTTELQAGNCSAASDPGRVSQRGVMANTGKPRPPSTDPYLVEVGGPGLSLRRLSFICQLFVCSVLHCHTALANLPNEPQELHHSGKKTTTE